jgi:Asp-tRNA(Asn)/Glu-tRNA(Gln) amidotransferase C subunit
MNRIVDYVASLDEVPAKGITEAFLAGPPAVRLREDVEAKVPLAWPPAAMAPEFADGFFLVPRHGSMEDQ